MKHTFLVLTKILYGYGISSRGGIGSGFHGKYSIVLHYQRDKIPIEKFISGHMKYESIIYASVLEYATNNCIIISFDLGDSMTSVCVSACVMCIFETISNIYKLHRRILSRGRKISNAVARHLFDMLHLIM